MTRIAMFYPCSPGPSAYLENAIEILKQYQCDIDLYRYEEHEHWPIYAASEDERKTLLFKKLQDPSIDIIWFARGGYGASNLLSGIENIECPNNKIIIGFSDITAIHSGLYRKKNIELIHGPMPGSKLFKEDLDGGTKELLNLIFKDKTKFEYDIEGTKEKVEGKLFGGCLSVLTNLIGTPYLPH